MYPLFELVRLLSIKEEGESGKSTVVSKVAWKETGEDNLLALYCTNGYLLLRYSTSGREATFHQLPWPHEKAVCAMCCDPTVSWLLVVSEDSTLFIIPARSILDKSAKVNQLWSLDNVTITKVKKPKGTPSVVVWWHTLEDQQVAIIGTKKGEILIVDLIKRCVVWELDIDAMIVNFDLVQDDQQMSTHLLITSQAGIQWKLLLESRTMEVVKFDREVSDLGYDQIDGRHFPVISIISVSEDLRHLFLPLRFYQFQRSVTLSPQYAKGRHFIAAHDNKSSTYQVYDSDIQHSPLFVYKLPLGAHNIILSDKTICTTTRLAGEKKLLVIANQKAETSMEDPKEFNKDAVLQHFDLPLDEKILTVVSKSYPFYWHDKKEEDLKQKMISEQEGLLSSSRYSGSFMSLDIHISGHTVMNGCLIITDVAVYECRPRISPERLFLDLATGKTDPTITDNLGISLGLDLNTLYEQSAENSVRTGSYSRAIKLFKLAKSSFIKRVSCFAKHGCVPEVMLHLRQALSGQASDLTTVEKKQLSNMAIHCFIYLQQQEKGDQNQKSFIDFLTSNFFYDENATIALLAENNLVYILLEMAKSRGLVMEALNLLAKNKHYTLDPEMISGLIEKGFTNHLIQAANGVFLEFLSPSSLMELLCVKPYLALQNYKLLQPVVSDLTVSQLEDLVVVFDPSCNLLKGHIARQLSARHRTASISSWSSDSDVTVLEGNIPDASKLLEFFLHIVLNLNAKRESNGHIPTIQELMSTSTREIQRTHSHENLPVQKRRRLPCQPRPIGAGSQHVALVRNGDLYTWGRTSNGRLGHGDLALENMVSSPFRVETLHMLQIKVLSVSCGGEHTIVLTQQGVYGWGSSKYGQVGTGTHHIYSRPMYIEKMSSVSCADIVCGQYHTLALTTEGDVYSWGWGVHGQLGHGKIEDCLTPRKISPLSDLHVTKIHAGYCHSLILTEQGSVYGFGCGFFGQLGLGNNKKSSVPLKISTLPEKIVAVGTRFFHSVAVSASNKVYTWGCHPYNLRFVAHAARKARQAGKFMGDPVERYLLPEVVDTCYVNGRITKVVCGSSHSMLITLDGDVYSWGRNMEGQIGNNTKHEMKIPNMVTAINDRQISHISSGGEFNVAMDTDGIVWVWGKNDCGQLGLENMDHSPSSSEKNVRNLASSRRRTNSNVTEVLVPTPCSGVPSAKPVSSLHHSTFSHSDSYESSDEFWPGQEKVESRHLDRLPDLQSLTDIKYSRIILLEVLQHLSDMCNCVHLLRICVDLQDWLSAVYICIHSQDYPQALTFHLYALKAYKENFKEKFQAIAAAIVNFYIQLCVKQDLSAGQKEENYRFILLQVMTFWEEEGLPTADLEKLILPYMDNMCCILSIFIFWSNSSEKEAKNFGVSNEMKHSFSTEFSLQVLQEVTDKLQHLDFEKKHPVCHQAFKSFTQMEHSNLDLQPSDKMIPYDQLWKDVVQNLQKGAESREFIYMTRSEIDHLDEKLHDQTRNLQNQDSVSDTNAVVFTCGHYFTKKHFVEELLVKFQRELTHGPASLPNSAQILLRYYNRKELLPLACPKCVLNALHSTT